MLYKSSEKILNYARRYRAEHKEKINAKMREYNKTTRKKQAEYSKKYYHKHRERAVKIQQLYRYKRRYTVMTHYARGMPICACCGELEYRFLTIDHVDNDGYLQRKELRMPSSVSFYRWLINNNFPTKLQVLCMNCNFGKRMNNGICPHKTNPYVLVH